MDAGRAHHPSTKLLWVRKHSKSAKTEKRRRTDRFIRKLIHLSRDGGRKRRGRTYFRRCFTGGFRSVTIRAKTALLIFSFAPSFLFVFHLCTRTAFFTARIGASRRHVVSATDSECGLLKIYVGFEKKREKKSRLTSGTRTRVHSVSDVTMDLLNDDEYRIFNCH